MGGGRHPILLAAHGLMGQEERNLSPELLGKKRE